MLLERSILWPNNVRNLWVKQDIQEPLTYEHTLNLLERAAVHSITQCLLNHGNLSSRSISGDYCSTEHSGKCGTTPCFYCKEEAGLGTRTSGTTQASGGHRCGPEILSASGRLHLIHRGKCSANSVFCQLSEPTLGPYFLSGTLVFPLFNPGLLTIWGNGSMAEQEHIEICLDGASPQVGGGRKDRGEFPWL